MIKPDPERLRPLKELPPPVDSKSLKRVLGLFAYYAKWIYQFSDKIRRLKQISTFPLGKTELTDFENLKQEIAKASLKSVDETMPFVVECDASDVAISATLNQGGRPVAFMSRSFQGSELHYPAVEKEATAIIEAVRKWNHFLSRQHFTLVTDQRSVSFMLDSRKRTKIKNNKIQCWRLELASYSYTIVYRPGKDNVAADSLTRTYCGSASGLSLTDIHAALCHPGITRLLHFVRTKNLPFSTDDVRRVCSTCRICAELKPSFYKPAVNQLIKATKSFERISLDFKGPLQSASSNKYLLVIIDEYSRFPFAFPCPDMYSSTVINCLNKLFSLCGMPQYVHSDNAKSFLSGSLKEFLMKRGIASSKSTPYHPTGNSQVERYIGVIWKSVRLALKSYNLPLSCWENVLQNALHSVRSLLNTTTNATPHELFFSFTRRSPSGTSLPAWLSVPGPVMLRKFVRLHKNDDLVDEVELINANPSYANIRYSDGRETSVSISDLSPCPRKPCQNEADFLKNLEDNDESSSLPQQSLNTSSDSSLTTTPALDSEPSYRDIMTLNQNNDTLNPVQYLNKSPRRSSRSTKGVPPVRYGHLISH